MRVGSVGVFLFFEVVMYSAVRKVRGQSGLAGLVKEVVGNKV